MIRITYILLITVLLSATSVASETDSLAWEMYAPVEQMGEHGLHRVKTYFFDANPGQQSQAEIAKLKQIHDSLAPITIGKVFMREVPNQHGLSDDTDTWYWWTVKEQDKTYLLCYVSGANANSSAKQTYYEITFKDGSKIKWEAPSTSPYNFNHMFVLINGTMQTVDPIHQQVTTVDASTSLHQKLLTTPIHYITKYDGHKSVAEDNLKFYPSLQYVFNNDESDALMSTLNIMADVDEAVAGR